MELSTLLECSSPGGPSCWVSSTQLVPAAGPHAAIAPAKFAARTGTTGEYAYEPRYLDGSLRTAVLVDSKQSQLNRIEEALAQAIMDGHPLLQRLPRIEVSYVQDGEEERYSDLVLPHRAFDGHIRAGTVDGQPSTKDARYLAARNATPHRARDLFDISPVSVLFGAWDSSRKARQWRGRSLLVGEIIGFTDATRPAMKGGARVDPVGMRIEAAPEELREIAERQREELSKKTYDEVKKGKAPKASTLGLGGVPPTLGSLGGVACDRIIRTHVLSFAALRQLRFGAGADGDAAIRALLAALALDGVARSDAELLLRANCDLREAAAARVTLDQRAGQELSLDPLTIAAADDLLAAALAHAEAAADVQWTGQILHVTGDPAVARGAQDDEDEQG
jgi:CRISPR-associated protein Csb1